MEKLSDLSTDELADGICSRAGSVAAAEAELLLWIGEFDRREGWAGRGLLSCAHWLSWRIGLSLATAREQVRVARRLEDLPVLARAFLDGRVSYSKVRAITRIAQSDDGIDWVGHAQHASAAQLEQIVRGVRRAQANAAAGLDPEAAAWSLRTRVRYDDHGNFVLTISGPAEHLPVIQAGLDAKKAELQHQRDAAAAASAGDALAEARVVPHDAAARTRDASAEAPAAPDLDAAAEGWPAGTTVSDVRATMAGFFATIERLQQDEQERPPPATDVPAPRAAPAARPESAGASAEAPAPSKVTDAEALLALAQDVLIAEQGAHPDIARRRRPQLTAQVDPLSGWARQSDGELLPPTSLRQVLKALPGRDGVLRLRPLTAADLRRHDLGRSHREASTALRELLGTLDGERCRFPGCTRRKKLHAHHVVYWSNGGGTDLDNLLLVCSRHHTLIHSRRFTLVLHPDRRLEVHTADGVAVLHHPAQPWADPAALPRPASAEALAATHGDARLDLGYVVSVLVAQAA